MSNINIKRAVENIKVGTTIYTPIVEIIVNSIQAIDHIDLGNGQIDIILKRSVQAQTDGSLPSIESIEIADNGIGFTPKNLQSFDTFYSDYKIEQGGKGFGRFICLKYFKDVSIESVYSVSGEYKKISFSMGKETEIIVNQRFSDSSMNQSYTLVKLLQVKTNSLEKTLLTIARNIVEKLLPYFITKNYSCPKIKLKEGDGAGEIILNDYICQSSAVIKEIEIDENIFTLGNDQDIYNFEVRVFKIYSPRNRVSKISLVADKREVTETSLHTYIPEFSEEFYDKRENGSDNGDKNYIIKSYVFSKYLDEHVSLERGGFDFQKESDLLYGISQKDIEVKVAEVTKKSVLVDISSRAERKKEQIMSYVEEEAPWHKRLVNNIDLSAFPYNPSHEEIEIRLQKEKFKNEIAIRSEVDSLLKEKDSDDFKESISKIVEKISESSKNDLIHYITLRRKVLELFMKSLKIDQEGKYPSEGVLHDIIFPRGGDSLSTGYDEHNLWIIDERLNFTTYISSDLPLNGGKTERPDLVTYDQRVAYRGDNDSSNPVVIFEFKKPNRDDFVNPSSKEDPVEQIVRYVNNIRRGSFKTPEGLKINIGDNTPFCGYVICSLTPKVELWLKESKNFKPMPDRMGWYTWRDNINLYIEVLSWDKLLKDSNMRNKIFFHKLGI